MYLIDKLNRLFASKASRTAALDATSSMRQVRCNHRNDYYGDRVCVYSTAE